MDMRSLARKVERLLLAVSSTGREEMGATKASSTAMSGSPAEGVFLLRHTAPTEWDATIYQPIVCLILQGEKVTTVGDETVTLSKGQCVLVSHDLPVVARITKASRSTPYLALVLRLDLAVLRSLYTEVGDEGFVVEGARALEASRVDHHVAAVIERLVDVLDDPVDARVLGPLLRKELHYRLLMSDAGAMLRSLLRRDSSASRVALAIEQLRDGYRGTLEVAELARSVGMSTSTFHKHFKAVTRTTPLQYQKELRLTEARHLLSSGQHSVSSAAFEVGYESPSQFSREYSRKFGTPPQTHLRRTA